MANSVTDSLLKAFSISIDKAVNDLSNDRTIKATIIECVNASLNQYSASYNGGIIDVYAQNNSSYSSGELVYVLIPMDDMSNRKYIIGTASEGEIVQEDSSVENSGKILADYSLIGKNAVYSVEIPGDNAVFPLTLYANKSENWFSCYSYADKIPSISNRKITLDDTNLSRNMEHCNALLLRAKFTTNLAAQVNGNYGITMIINVTLEDGTTSSIPYTLDIRIMQGDPMKYYMGISQYIICDFSKYKFNYIENIFCFSNGFSTDLDDEQTIIIDKLEIYALNALGTNGSDYALSLTTPLGNSLTEKNNEVTIEAKIFNNGNDITSSANIYWGIEDFTINSLSPDYNVKLGSGFKYLSKFDNQNSIKVDLSSNPSKINKYKCAVLCNESILLEQEIFVYNDINLYNISLETKNTENNIFYPINGNITLTCLINGKKYNFIDTSDDSEFSFIWSKEDSYDGLYTFKKTKDELEDERDTELLNAGSNLIEQDRIKSKYTTLLNKLDGYTFTKGISGNIIIVPPKNSKYYCTVKKNGAIIGRAEIDLRSAATSLSQKTYITIKNGNQYFQYNERGISPASERIKEQITILLPTIEFRNPLTGDVIENIQDYCYWDFPKEDTMIVSPSENLTEEGWYKGQSFPLKIVEDYDNNKTNNQLTAIVKWNDNIYRASTNFSFAKVGEAGTNGTSFAAKITPNFVPQNIQAKLCLIQENDLVYWNALSIDGSYLPLNTQDVPFNSYLYLNNELQSGYNTFWSLYGGYEKRTEDTDGKTITTSEGYVYSIDSSTGRISLTDNNSNRTPDQDFRTIRSKNSMNGNNYYSYFNLPSIKYYNGYTYSTSPIDIIDSETLNYITYNADDCDPSYNKNIGITLEMDENLYKTSTITFAAESGKKTASGFQNPNFLLSFNQGSATGGNSISINNAKDSFNDFSSIIKEIARNDDTGEAIKIQTYLNDLFAIGYDAAALVSNVQKYLNQIEKEYYIDNQWTNAVVKDLYFEYLKIVKSIKQEYNTISVVNSQLNENRVQLYKALNGGSWKNLKLPYQQFGDSVECGSQKIETYQELLDCARTRLSDIDDDIKGGYSSKRLAIQNKIFDGLFNFDTTVSFTRKINNVINNIEFSIDTNYSKVFDEQKSYYLEVYNTFIDKITNDNKNSIVSLSEISSFEAKIDELIDMAMSLFVNNAETISVDPNEIAAVANCKQIFTDKNTVKVKAYLVPKDRYSSLYANNNVKITIIDSNDKIVAEVTVPICFMTNTYSLSSLNDWDGTGIKINEEEGYILSPQIGAGIKNELDNNNTFTGIVMGSLTNPSTDGTYTSEKIGLMGFSDGRQSIFLNAKTGSATFGLKDGGESDGCIELIPHGTSKIANWNIGKNLLYSCTSGTLESRTDSDSRDLLTKKPMIARDESGVLLSSNMPYIHIKGKPFSASYVKNIQRTLDSSGTISVGDSLELRLDPDNKSLFSIWQHTDSFNNELDDNAAEVKYGIYNKNAIEKRVADFDINNRSIDESKIYTTYWIPKENNKNLSYYTFGNDLIQYSADNIYSIDPIINTFNYDWVLNSTQSIIPFTENDVYNFTLENYKVDGEGIAYQSSLNIDEENNKIIGRISCEPGTKEFKQVIYTIQTAEPQTQIGYADKEIKLYSFTLFNEQENLNLTQPISFSGEMSEDAGLKWKYVLKNSYNTIIAESSSDGSYFTQNTYDSNITFYKKAGITVFDKDIELTVYLVLKSNDKSYHYAADVIGDFEATVGFVPDINIELKYNDIIGSYVQMYGSEKQIIVPGNDNIEFKYTTGYFQIDPTNNESYTNAYKVTNTSENASFTMVFYCISSTTGTESVSSVYTYNFRPKEEHYFAVGPQTNLFYSWRYAVYPYQGTELERPSISDKPKYKMNGIELKFRNKEQLIIDLGEPTNFNNLIPVDKDLLCVDGNIIGYPIAETQANNAGEPVVTIDKAILTRNITNKIPFIDWLKDEDNYVIFVRAFDSSKVEEWFNNNAGNDKAIFYPRNNDFDTSLLAIEEYLKVGIDENGKFFSNGKSNTSNRVGRIKIFDTYYGYGQEISYANTNQICKIAANENSKDTFITPGLNKNLNIVANNSISLYLPNLQSKSVIDPVPNSYNGIKIADDNIELRVKNNILSIESNTIDNLKESLSPDRVLKEKNLFDDINYNKLVKLLNSTNYNKIIELLVNLDKIKTAVQANGNTWTEVNNGEV